MNKDKKAKASERQKISRKKKKLESNRNQSTNREEISENPVISEKIYDEIDPTLEEEITSSVDEPEDLTEVKIQPEIKEHEVTAEPLTSASIKNVPAHEITILGRKFDLQTILAFLALPAIIFTIYSNVYNVEFLYDDEKEIELHRELHITEFSWNKIKKAFTVSHRPVAKLSFAVNYYFDRLNTRYYHLVNILIHISNAILLYFFIKFTMNMPAVRNRRGPPGWIPFCASLLWAVNPTHIQSVTYVVQRMNSMSAMFFLITLLLYVHGRLKQNIIQQCCMYFGCVITTILALGSKEIAGTIPLVIFLYEWFFFQDMDLKWLKKRLPFIIGAFIVFLAVGLYYLGLDPMAKLQAKYRYTTFNMGQRVMTEWRVVMFYVSQLLYPHPSQFNLLHDFSISASFFSPITTLFSFIAILLSLIAAGVLARKERLISFCILWFFGNLAIESTVIGLEIIYEHRSYLPSMFLILMIILIGNFIIKNGIAKKVILAGLIGTCCFWTYSRNSTWANEIDFWLDTIEKNPKASRAYNDLANAYAQEGQKRKAVDIYYKGLKLDYNDWKMHFNLGVILDSLWESEKALEQFKWVLRVKPNFAELHKHLGLIYARQKNYPMAIKHTEEAIRLDPIGAEGLKKNLVTYRRWMQSGGPRRTKKR